jgi:hypothetical protein
MLKMGRRRPVLQKGEREIVRDALLMESGSWLRLWL